MHCPTKTHYIDRHHLANLVRDHRLSGVISNELGAALVAIAGGVWDRYHFTADRDDFVQDVVLHLIQTPLKKADITKHCFNYFTTCAIRFGGKLRDKACGERRRFEAYAADLVEDGHELHERE